MNNRYKNTFLFLLAISLPLTSYAGAIINQNLALIIHIIAIVNFILLVTSIISIIQFIRPGEVNRTPFQIFNLIFIIAFYAVSLPFLVNHKDYFEGFGNLSDAEVIKRYFLSTDLFDMIKRLILVAFVLNIIYILRNSKEYYINT